MKSLSIHVALIAALMLLVPATQSVADTPAQSAIKAVMHGMFEKPNVELVIDPVLVEGGFAVADWTQGEIGGRAFLKESASKWTLILCTATRFVRPKHWRQAAFRPAPQSAWQRPSLRRKEA